MQGRSPTGSGLQALRGWTKRLVGIWGGPITLPARRAARSVCKSRCIPTHHQQEDLRKEQRVTTTTYVAGDSPVGTGLSRTVVFCQWAVGPSGRRTIHTSASADQRRLDRAQRGGVPVVTSSSARTQGNQRGCRCRCLRSVRRLRRRGPNRTTCIATRSASRPSLLGSGSRIASCHESNSFVTEVRRSR